MKNKYNIIAPKELNEVYPKLQEHTVKALFDRLNREMTIQAQKNSFALDTELSAQEMEFSNIIEKELKSAGYKVDLNDYQNKQGGFIIIEWPKSKAAA